MAKKPKQKIFNLFMEQKNKHRLAKVAKEFGVGVSTLLDFFNNEGIPGLNPNSKIDQDLYQKALNKFGDEKLIKEKIIEQKEQDAQMFKKAVSIDDVNSSDTELVETEKSEEFFVKDQSNVDNKNDADDEINDKKTNKQTEDVDEKKQQVGPKVLGKINLDDFKTKKTPKNKKKKEIKKTTKKEEPTVVEQKIEDNIDNISENKPPKEQELKVVEKEEIKEIIEQEIVKEKVLEEKEVSNKEEQRIEVVEDKKIEKEEKTEKEEIIVNTSVDEKNQIKEEEKDTIKHIETEDIEKLKGPKVIGKIDLKSMNLKTRPDKKTKKEKEDERKKRQQEQRKARKKSSVSTNKKDPKKEGAKPFDKNRSKKRKGPRVEKVEINKEGRIIGNKNTKRLKKKKVVPVVTDEVDVQKQVRETLQKLEQKQKSQAAKFRKNKRKEHHKRATQEFEKQEAENKILKLTEFITVKELSDLMNIAPNKIIELCFDLGQPVTINFRLDAELINMISEEFMFEIEYVQSSFEEEVEQMLSAEDNQVEFRPPIVTVMGHVDHGKTSLLDYIRETNVVASESGGITQHIGAYSVKQSNKMITFIDTPGHEAFTAMRARGTKVTDIAIIIIAADDSIMPQTEEAIDHARAAGVPMVFAINKIDKNGADPERIKQQLAEHNLLVEDWGGKYGCVEISAKKGIGIEDLLERVWLEAEMLELKANPKRNAIATVLEARLDKGRGYITNIIVRTGTLSVGDVIVAGAYYGKVKALYNEYDKKVKKVGPSMPIQILGLNGAPEPGDPLVVMDNDREAREKADQRLQIIRELEMRARKKHSLEDISKRLAEGEKLDLNFIVKADVKGSADAITDQIQRLSNEEVNVNVIRSAVGQISDNDIMLAAASNTIIVGFNVRPSLGARKLAENKSIEIRLYSIIYDIINDVKAAVHGMLAPVFKEEILGSAEVLNVFKISKVGTIAGSLVRDGKLIQNNNVRVIRDGIVIYTGKLESLKRYKDDVKEVQKGYECGIGVENFNDIKVGDFIEAFKDVEVERKFE